MVLRGPDAKVENMQTQDKRFYTAFTYRYFTG